MAFPNMKETGPLVLEIPPGATAGGFTDFWQRPVSDTGQTGPDKGMGGKYLILGPDDPEMNPEGYRVFRSPTVNVFVGQRVLDPDKAKALELMAAIRIYPYSQADHPPATPLLAAATALNVAHTARLTSDPDLKALQGDLAAVTELRKEKSVSLNLAKRKTERDRLEAERLARENARRAAHGETALKDAEAMAATEVPDALLTEAVRITADWAAMGGTGAAQTAPGKPRMVHAQPRMPAKANGV
jgi:hypothetical protein